MTIKNAANVDKTFTLLTPAAGYGTPADWALKEGATSVVWPTFSISAERQRANKVRKVRASFRLPATYVSITTGLPVVSSTVDVQVLYALPDDFPDDQKDDAVAYFKNLMGNPLVVSCFRDALTAS